MPGTGAHTAAGNKDSGKVHAGRRFQVGRDGFVAAAGQDHAVPGHGAGVYLDHIRDGFTGCKHDIHAVVSLRAAVADIGGMVVGRETALFKNADLGLSGKLMEMDTARVRVAVYVFDHDLGLMDVGIIPAAAHLKGVELRPPQPFLCTFLFHEDLLGNTFVFRYV